jgi:tRNA dimethylallyltransferase
MAHATEPLLVVITGPTATGKTRLAAHLAKAIDGEVISADSRQVYRGMDMGTGKDLSDFLIDGYLVPYHLIDIVDPGYEYNLFEYLQDFSTAFKNVTSREKQPILCGGTGLYIEATLKGYNMQKVPVDLALRKKLDLLTIEELTAMLESFGPLHNKTDTSDRERLVRAVEIHSYQSANQKPRKLPSFRHVIFAIDYPREILRQRISERLESRLKQGMTEEVQKLLTTGLKPQQLIFYGLEYRYLTLYAIGEISYVEMVTKLNTAIHQFAKRQMTWFRRMERQGFNIHWLDGSQDMSYKLTKILQVLNGNNW